MSAEVTRTNAWRSSQGVRTTIHDAPGEGLTALPPGHVVANRYRVLESIGRGRQGVVYRARDLVTQRLVALKLSRPRRTGAPPLLGLGHRHVQRLLAWGNQGGVEYHVTSLYAGWDLERVLRRRGPLPLGAVVGIGTRLLSALDHLHRHGVVHRDVKPSNVILGPKQLVLIDFDLAARLDDPQDLNRMAGTPLFMSRERLRGCPATPADDLFACALVLYELAAGVLPTHPRTFSSVDELEDARADPIRSVGTLDRFFERALAVNAGNRFQRAAAAAVALGDAA